jgi:ankyrin repeat protein
MNASLDVTRCLVKDLGADVDQICGPEGVTALHVAAAKGLLDLATCLVMELGANVNAGNRDGCTALWNAARYGRLDLVRELLKLKANVDQAPSNGITPLMTASFGKHEEVVVWLIKAGADAQLSMHGFHQTAADVSRVEGASASQTAYLEAKTHCSNPGCSGAGLKKCPACKHARYCGEPCQLAHWKAHKADCKRWSGVLKC